MKPAQLLMVNVKFYQITLKSTAGLKSEGQAKDIRKSVNERDNWKINETFKLLKYF